jgi:ParB-like chromosome segregation protein Spo0J
VSFDYREKIKTAQLKRVLNKHMSDDLHLSVAMAKRIDLWPLDRLNPYDRNARTHSAEQVAQIAASILEFGFTNPILVDSHDGIVAGHGRFAAAQQLGLKTVPVVVLDHLSDRQRRAYILADNKLALNAGWDIDMLQSELGELRDFDVDLSVLGWAEDELANLIDKPFEFEPASEDEQGRLDERKTEEIDCVCPACGHEFIKQN